MSESPRPIRSEERSDQIARLLRLAEPRPDVPEETEARVRASTHAAWKRSVGGARRRTYLWGGIALAAAAALAVALIPGGKVDTPTPVTSEILVASLETAVGHVRGASAGQSEHTLQSGERLYAGSTIETGGDARAALTLTNGASLRLDTDTRIRLVAARVLELESGGLYFDSANSAGDPIEIRADLGVVRDIGTQFEVRALDDLRIRVREGLVNLDSLGSNYEAAAGIELRLSETGDLSRHDSPLFGPSWDWVLEVAPPFILEGHTLDSFLAWVSRETGWTAEFVDPAVADSAAEVVLHGSIEGLRPDRALEAVLPTCGLEYRFEGGVLLIEAETR